MKKTLVIALLATLLIGAISCSRTLTASQAANGHARCGRSVNW
ncbi:MAG TPA: hypothetical protein VK559_11050 [Ferruginibacter sp.]|nr:hypothetical protein [Ferruginibacter sp.]